MRQLRLRLAPSGDGGFTLIESVMALLIAGVVFSALASSSVAAVKASLAGRQDQQATDFMTRELERARSLGFGALAHTASDLTGDARLTTCSGGYCLDPDGSGPLTSETVHVGPGAGVVPHITTPTAAEANHTTFTAATYVTQVPGSDVDDVRRVTVFITWVNGGQTKTRSTSSLVAYTQRGLPLPQFKLAAAPTAISVNPGAEVVYTLSLTNQGAPDRWNITLTGPGATRPWSLLRDTNGNGTYEAATDTTSLADTTSDGTVDTGRLDPSTSVVFFAVWSTTVGTPATTEVTTVTATSVGQPTAAAAAAAVPLTTTLTDAPVVPTPTATVPPETGDCAWTGPAVAATSPGTGYTIRQYTLHQDPTGFDSEALPLLAMDLAAADEPALRRWSIDVDGTVTGRGLRPTSPILTDAQVLSSLTDPKDFADWRYQASANTSVGGTAALRLWVAGVPASSDALSAKAVVYSYTKSGGSYTATAIGAADVVLPAAVCSGLREVRTAVPVTTTPLKNNDQVGVRLVNRTGSLLRVAYDVPGAYDSRLELATK